MSSYLFETLTGAHALSLTTEDALSFGAGDDTISGSKTEAVYDRLQRNSSNIRKVNARDIKRGNASAYTQGRSHGPR